MKKIMNEEDKELLLKDLSARLPYGVKTKYKDIIMEIFVVSTFLDNMCCLRWDSNGHYNQTHAHIGQFKPYLRPMSSMTEEEEIAYCKTWYDPLFDLATRQHTREEEPMMFAKAHYDSIVFLLENHFDFLGLIPLGLAIEVTEDNNPYKDKL